MAINPFEVASKYGYNAATFAGDQNFQSYWSNKTEAQLLGGLQARGDWYAGRMNLQVPPAPTGNLSPANGSPTLINGQNGTSFNNNQIANMFSSGQADSYNAAMMLQQNREQSLQRDMEQQQQRYDQATTSLDQWLGRDVYQELLAERNKQGYDEKLGLLNQYNSQLRDLTLDYQMGTQNIKRESRLESMTKGRMANIYEQYANEATLVNNNIAGVQGQLDRIEKNTDKFFEFYTQQRSDMIENYSSLRDLASQNIISLSKEEREDIDRRIDIMNTEVERGTKERESKMSILMAAYEKGVDPSKYGVSLTDDFATLMNKVGPAVAAQYQSELAKKYAGSGSGSGGSSFASSDQMTSDTEIAAQKLARLRDAGKLNDANYKAEILRIMDRNNMSEDDYGMISSVVNNIMGGGSSQQGGNTTTTRTNKYGAGSSFGRTQGSTMQFYGQQETAKEKRKREQEEREAAARALSESGALQTPRANPFSLNIQ